MAPIRRLPSFETELLIYLHPIFKFQLNWTNPISHDHTSFLLPGTIDLIKWHRCCDIESCSTDKFSKYLIFGSPFRYTYLPSPFQFLFEPLLFCIESDFWSLFRVLFWNFVNSFRIFTTRKHSCHRRKKNLSKGLIFARHDGPATIREHMSLYWLLTRLPMVKLVRFWAHRTMKIPQTQHRHTMTSKKSLLVTNLSWDKHLQDN